MVVIMNSPHFIFMSFCFEPFQSGTLIFHSFPLDAIIQQRPRLYVDKRRHLPQTRLLIPSGKEGVSV
jgi:hypothetical protein